MSDPRPLVGRLADQVKHMAKVAHDAYHTSGEDYLVNWKECSRPFCRDAKMIFEEYEQTQHRDGGV
jgi:hypothetical protein